MTSVVTILLLLLAVVVSAFAARLTRLPLPVVQVILGAGIALSAIPTVELEPELFFLLFLPPLLFLDGWRIPKDDLRRDRATVFELAVGLVVLTVVGVGFLIHWLIPAMPLPVAFALAAVVSPTDPIAVAAIAARVPIPKRMMHILEGEALLNDASGLVCMRFAVSATMTGVFVLHEAIGSFVWVAAGGSGIGVGVAWAVMIAKEWLVRRLGEDTGSQILISLLMPFGAYLLAEQFHCSGILAAVAAGVTMGFMEQSGQAHATTRVRRATVWDAVQFTANGIIFVLLGEQMPGLAMKADETVRATGHSEPWWLGVYVLAISAALGAMRFVWVWASLKLTLFRGRRESDVQIKTDWRVIAAMSMAGVRGAITLAGVLTLPLALPDGSPFPARDLAIFLAGGVILVSLTVASLGLPRLLKDLELPPEPSHQAEIDEARLAAAQAAIAAVEKAQRELASERDDADLYADVASLVMDVYRSRITGRQQGPEVANRAREFEQIERKLRVAGLVAERAELFRRSRLRQLNGEIARKMIREIDLQEARYSV